MSQSTNEVTYDKVKASFGPNAHAYTISKGHSDANVLRKLVERVGPNVSDRVLDIGTGAGHTAIAFGPFVQNVIALDLTPQMLEEVERNAAAKNVTNIEVKQGAAENLPFGEGEFDIVTCRLTTHHFADLPQAVREMGRVLKSGGKLVISDSTVPEDAVLDHQINEIEILRDPSHVRNYPEKEWRELLEGEAHLKIVEVEADYYDEGDKMDFYNWTGRIGTSAESVARLETLFREASPALKEALRIELEGEKIRFALPRITIIAVK